VSAAPFLTPATPPPSAPSKAPRVPFWRKNERRYFHEADAPEARQARRRPQPFRVVERLHVGTNDDGTPKVRRATVTKYGVPGAFGKCAPHLYNALVKGTSGSPRDLPAEAAK
jgi:hypothetical protein